MAENDFLSFLVDETLRLQQSGESKLSSLELKLTDYKLNFLKGEFIPQIQVLRFKTNFGLLDIPINWSFFSMDNNLGPEHILSREKDPDHFFEVLTSSWNENLSRILITHADGFCYLVGLLKGEESHLHDLLHPQEWFEKSA